MVKYKITEYIEKWTTVEDVDWVMSIKPKDIYSGYLVSSISSKELGSLVLRYKYTLDINSDIRDTICIDKIKLLLDKKTLYLPIDIRIVTGFNEKADNDRVIEKIHDSDLFMAAYGVYSDLSMTALGEMFYSVLTIDDKRLWKTRMALMVSEDKSYDDLEPLYLKKIKKVMSAINIFN